MKKIIIGLVVLFILLGGYFYFQNGGATTNTVENTAEESKEVYVNNKPRPGFSVSEPAAAKEVVSQGAYYVFTDQSTFNWAGKKPLIDGYVNTGSIALKEGVIEVGENEATGKFSIDMNTLQVSNTPTKPGMESLLVEHLKSDKWFDVETYPEAVFEITSVTARPDSNETYTYDVVGELTMKGETGELSFPALIYSDDLGMLRAEAQLEFDRTKWGITSGSGNFFDNLADNVIDDMVSLSFSLVAEGR